MFYSRADIIKGMNENLFELFGDVFVTDFSITGDDYKKIIDLGEYGQFETYSDVYKRQMVLHPFLRMVV